MSDSRAPVAVVAVLTEVRPILARGQILSSQRADVCTVWETRLAGHTVFVAGCPAGKVNAAMAAQVLIERYRPAAIVSCGSAGSLSPAVRAGDLLIASQAVPHDAGLLLGQRFLPLGAQVARRGRLLSQRVFVADAALIRAARSAAGALASDGHRPAPAVHVGPVASGDQVLFSHQRKAELARVWHALAVDMETAAVAQAAQAHGVSWLGIRGISDSADEEAGLDLSRLAAFVEDGSWPLGWAKRQARRAGYLLRDRHAVGRLRRLIAGVRLGADRAAALLAGTVARL